MPKIYHSLYGLRLRSALDLPELPHVETGEYDVDVRLVDQLPEAGTRFHIEQLASFAVDAGCRIFVQPEDLASPANIRLFLLGTAMGLLLHQRGDLPLHANSLMAEGRAAVVMGASGSGKSSLAAWMQRHEVTPLSDDVCVIRLNGNGPFRLFPGVSRIRLWEDAVLREGKDPHALAPVFEGDPDYRKFYVPIEREEAAQSGVEVACAYVLAKGDGFRIEPIGGAEAVEAYFANTYRGEYVQTDGLPQRHWEICTRLAADVPTYKVTRTMELDRLEAENSDILSHLQACIRSTKQA